MAAGERPTLTGVAHVAGVSIASASRVLNGLPASPEMQERVRAAVAQLGYVPDATARSLKTGRTEQLTLAVADVGNPFYVEILRAVEGVVRGAGYRLMVSSTGSDPNEEIRLVSGLAPGITDGLVLCPLRITEDLVAELAEARIPVVVVGTLPADVALDNVQADSARGVRLALEHLHANGHRRVAFVNGPADTVPGSARARGFAHTARTLGLDRDPALRVDAGDCTFAAGRVAAAELLARVQPDAVLGANDLLAVAVIHELAARGLSVPGDVAVVGMDDTELATLCSPSLTSVGLGSAERGRIAAQLLLERIADPSLPPRRVKVRPTLTCRASSGPARRSP